LKKKAPNPQEEKGGAEGMPRGWEEKKRIKKPGGGNVAENDQICRKGRKRAPRKRAVPKIERGPPENLDFSCRGRGEKRGGEKYSRGGGMYKKGLRKKGGGKLRECIKKKREESIEDGSLQEKGGKIANSSCRREEECSG